MLLTFFSYAELQKKKKKILSMTQKRSGLTLPALQQQHVAVKKATLPRPWTCAGQSEVHGAESGPDSSPAPTAKPRAIPRCPHGLGMSTSGTHASQSVLQALCGQANPGPLRTPLINPEYKNSPAGFPASPPSPPTAPQGKRKEEKLVKQN